MKAEVEETAQGQLDYRRWQCPGKGNEGAEDCGGLVEVMVLEMMRPQHPIEKVSSTARVQTSESKSRKCVPAIPDSPAVWLVILALWSPSALTFVPRLVSKHLIPSLRCPSFLITTFSAYVK